MQFTLSIINMHLLLVSGLYYHNVLMHFLLVSGLYYHNVLMHFLLGKWSVSS